jgi:hypothetical protein
MDLGVDLHAGDEAQLPALAFEVAAARVDSRAMDINKAAFTFSG